MSRASQRRPREQFPAAHTLSKDGYSFDPSDDYWKLNKDVRVSLVLPATLDPATRRGFRAALQRYAEEASAQHTENICSRFRRYLRDTGATQVTVSDLLSWRAILNDTEQWLLGGLKGFLIAWHEYGFEGVSKDVVDLLTGLRIKGNRRGCAVLNGCPERGPFTDLELAALLDQANIAVAKGKISFRDYAYLLALAMTARRPVQIAALRGKDLLETDGRQFRLNVPRAKQFYTGFRQLFRSLLIIEDLFVVLRHQHERSVMAIEESIKGKLSEATRGEVPIFLNDHGFSHVASEAQVSQLLLGRAPDALHVTTGVLRESLRRCAAVLRARSERTGKILRLSARRFRYTRGTKLRREGFGALIIAELLDHSDTQNVKVYTENTAREAVVINQLIGGQLAPFAQACLGRLVSSEREAIRGDDPRSRVPNHNQNAVGNCGNYGFCASGFRACYTCHHFQPWVDGPHQDVLDELYREKERVREAGCAPVVVNANDQLILAVEHCVLLCKAAKAQANTE